MNQLWPRPRDRNHRSFTALEQHPHASILLGMQLFLDRWLLILYAEGAIQLYDMDNIEQGPHAVHHTIGPSGWSSFSAVVDPVSDILILAVARSVPAYLLNIFRIDLKDCTNLKPNESNKAMFVLLKQLSLDSPKVVQAIEPELGVLAVSASSKVQLVSWRDLEVQSQGNFSIPAYPDDPNDLWDGINLIRFMGPYILIARTRSIEVHHFLSTLHPTTTQKLPPLKHHFRLSTFKDVSLSNCKAGRPSGVGQTFEMIMLAYDVIQGLFQFKVELFVPSIGLETGRGRQKPSSLLLDSENQSKLTVTQIGLYPLGLPHPSGSGALPTTPHNHHSPSPTVGSDSPTPTSFSQTHFLQNISHLAHGTSTRTSRGFLSAFSMGAQGLRVIWVERRRGGVSREIQVWSRSMMLDAQERPSSAWVFQFGADSVEMEKQVVFTINSHDLRDDIIFCAFSESRGVIALGNRLGKVLIVPLE